MPIAIGDDWRFVALRDMDGEFRRMMEIKHFCDEHAVSYPKEVQEYFSKYVDEEGKIDEGFHTEESIADDMREVDVNGHLRYWRSADDNAQGYEIDIGALPKDVKTIRIYQSW